jgi:hypothetical protein
MQVNKIKNQFFIVLLLSLFSCDRDLNDIGTDVVGDNHFDMKMIKLDIKAYNQPLGPVNSINLTNNPIGVYENAMGKTVAHFVSQVELSSLTSNIVTPATVVIENVYLEVPYSSRQTVASTDAPNYEITNTMYPKFSETSITNKFKLNVFENGFDLRVSNTEGQEIYMNEKAKFLPFLRGTDASGNSVIGGTRLNDATESSENEQFFFNSTFVNEEDYISTTTPTPSSKVAPKMRLKLNKNYFKKKIFENTSVLANQDLFKNHFKGLYFQVQEITGNKSMAMLDFSNAKIIIQYKDEVTSGNFTKKQYIINVKGITASLQDFIPDPVKFNPVIGSEAQELFLKGGAGGNMIVLGINNSGTSTTANTETLNFLKAKKSKIVINDAYIEYYIDKSFYDVTGLSETDAEAIIALNNPFRTIAYNLPNESTLLDFQLDNSTVSGNRLYDKSVFGGILYKNPDSNEYYYRVRVTQHLINIIKTEEALNSSIGIVASNDINAFGTGNFIFKSKLKTEISTIPTFNVGINDNLSMEQSPSGLLKIKNIPTSSVVVPVGSKIYGTASTDAKKMKLVVYYSEKN